MSRWINESFDNLTALMSVPMMVFLSIVLTILIAVGWYFWPAWLPWHWKRRDPGARDRAARSRDGQRRFRLGRLRWRLRWRRRRNRAVTPDDVDELPADELPELPAAVLALSADQLAAAGRYAEAVRERLRSIVRDLIERGLIPPSPGWTVTEMARQAGTTLPPLAAPMVAAVDVFSRIWYGLLPAHAEDDAAMRSYAETITQTLATTRVGSST